MNGAPTAKPPQFNPKSPLLEEAGSQPPTSRILRESKSTISRPRGWQGQPEVINFLRLPPPVCVYFRQRHGSPRRNEGPESFSHGKERKRASARHGNGWERDFQSRKPQSCHHQSRGKRKNSDPQALATAPQKQPPKADAFTSYGLSNDCSGLASAKPMKTCGAVAGAKSSELTFFRPPEDLPTTTWQSRLLPSSVEKFPLNFASASPRRNRRFPSRTEATRATRRA